MEPFFAYIGLGGNFETSFSAFKKAVHFLSEIKEIDELKVSHLYRSTPISDIKQPDFLNAACGFVTHLSVWELWETLQQLEIKLGKQPKAKNAPRLIDIDLLFYGEMVYYSNKLIIPHPKWHERLFVLLPLAEIATYLPLNMNMQAVLKKFSNPHQERVTLCGPLI